MIAGTLELQMMANIARLQKDMSEARKTVDSAMSGIKSAADVGIKALGALGVGLSVNYFKNMITGSINAQDELIKMSARVGVSVESLAGLEYAAGLSGASLDGVQKGLKTISERLVDADAGLKSSQQEFSALGISIYDANGALKSSDGIMIEVADRFAAMEDGARKTAAATGLFGKAGLDLIPMLNGGSAALAEMVAEGQRYNPVTEESAKQAEIFNDNISRLQAAGQGLGVTFVNWILPALANFSTWMVEFSRDNTFKDALSAIAVASSEWVVDMQKMLVSLDNAFSALWSNVETGGLSMSEIVQLTLGTTMINIRTLIQTLTVEAASYLDRLKIASSDMSATLAGDAYWALNSIGLGNTELAQKMLKTWQEAYAGPGGLQDQIDGIDEARKDSLAEFLASNKAQIEGLHDQVAASLRGRLEIVKLTDAVGDYSAEVEESAAQTDEQAKKTTELIAKLKQESESLAMTDRARAIYKSTMDAVNAGALPEQIALIAELSVKNYDLAEATRTAEQAETERQRVVEQAAQAAIKAREAETKAAQDQWNDTKNWLADAFVSIRDNGRSAFQQIGDMAVATIKRIVAEWAAVKALEFFGMGSPAGGGGSGGAGSLLSSIGTSAAGKAITSLITGGRAASGVAGAIQAGGVGGVGGTVAAGGGIGGALSAAGSSVMGALGAIPGWGWALGGAALLANALAKDETPSANAGMLIRPVGDGSRQFDVPAFASGLDPVGFARREDQSKAVEVIDTFRAYDQALTNIARASGLSVNYSANQFGGFSEKGTGNGLYFGAATEDGRNTAVPIEQQLTQFVGQWIRGLSGQVDQALIDEVLAAGGADEMLKRAGAIAGIDGSHANGLDYVPRDGYIGELHQGEAVLTESENRTRRANEAAMPAVVDELRKSRAELADMRRLMTNVYNLMDKWDGQEGLAPA